MARLLSTTVFCNAVVLPIPGLPAVTRLLCTARLHSLQTLLQQRLEGRELGSELTWLLLLVRQPPPAAQHTVMTAHLLSAAEDATFSSHFLEPPAAPPAALHINNQPFAMPVVWSW